MPLPRILTIMGSGETAPTMMKTHRALVERLGEAPRAVVLDTPYGFQANAPELAARAQEYFRKSVGLSIEVAGLHRVRDADELTLAQGLTRVRDANFLFAGPGSPTYALRQWANSPVPGEILAKLRGGGVVTFASAAALTLGRFTVPVYEIYKVGEDPYWLDGLDLLAEMNLNVAVIPHYDNAEGGHHDTRFCYLGESRLRILEERLPDDAHVLGIDEHTGIVIDLDTESVTVVGNGTITVRVKGESTVFSAGSELHLDDLRNPGGSRSAPGAAARVVPPTPASDAAPAAERASLATDTARCERNFNAAVEARNAEDAARAVLELEAAIHAWSADTNQSEDGDRARAAVRSMIVKLGQAAAGGLTDPRSVIGPFVEGLLAVRAAVRAEKRYDLSDVVRDQLLAAGVEVRDTKEGVQWEMRSPD
ncbi:MAG: hypothetical protein F2934_09405 [Actinobacteria bacterium]|uniref:Unannotated protein n=1 Tax=freshwater metagenome TaxID=449393 RepID=A0A6J7UQJ0_9ZZZZ|nr:hypothetical protein [Actinomycetota bacterium]